MTAPFTVEALANYHDRASFACGVEALDRYIAAQAMQDQRRRVAGCYVALDAATGQIAGFYTIAAASMPLGEVSPELAKKLPRCPVVPCVRLRRLAIATAHQGKGLAAALLIDAIERSLRSEIAAFAMIVDAKDESAVRFYSHQGFEAFLSAPMTLYLPLAEVAKRLGS